jgi:hypothetical protein
MKKLTLLISTIFVVGCGGGGSVNVAKSSGGSWYYQLQGKLLDVGAKVYDIDLYETSPATIKELKSKGKYVVCYFSAGSWEDWRADASEFPKSALGNKLNGWAGERWLDITNNKVKDIMRKRVALAKSKGCDAIEPDNVNGYDNDSGFNLSYSNQINYNKFFASLAKSNALAIGLKNDLEQIDDLVDSFDFAINEECFEFGECSYLKPFTDAKKPVYNIEYKKSYTKASEFSKLCKRAKDLNIYTIVENKALNGSQITSCDY